MSARDRSRLGFTLIELLVVIALIVALAAVAIPGINGGGSIASIHVAEANVAGLLAKARTDAILSRRAARVLIAADPAKRDDYLGVMAIALKNTSGASWSLQGSAYRLPQGVRVVPQQSVPAEHGVLWPADAKSVFDGNGTTAIAGFDVASYVFIEFGANGAIANGRQILLSPVHLRANGPEFFLPTEVRIFLFRNTGNFVLMRDAASL